MKVSDAGMTLERTVTNSAGQTYPNPFNDNLIDQYRRAIDPNIVKSILLFNPPTYIDEWMQKATELDALQKRTNNLFAKTFRHDLGDKRKNVWKPKFQYRQYNQGNGQGGSSKQSHYGEPMDVDYAGTEDRKANNLCYKCGKPGHFIRDCRSNSNGSQSRPTNQKNQKQPAQQNRNQQKPRPKPNYQQLRQKIGALISENIDQDSPEFEEFIQEVEEKGFQMRE